jgi:hypothetical protein
MKALTVRLPDEKHERLKRLARERGTTVDCLIDERATILLAGQDAEVFFNVRARCGAGRRAAGGGWGCSGGRWGSDSRSSLARDDGRTSGPRRRDCVAYPPVSA